MGMNDSPLPRQASVRLENGNRREPVGESGMVGTFEMHTLLSTPIREKAVRNEIGRGFGNTMNNVLRSLITGIVFSLSIAAASRRRGSPAIIPAPQKMELRKGEFKLTPDTRIYIDSASRNTGEFLAAQLRKSTGCEFKFSASSIARSMITGGILLTTDSANPSLGAEGYELTVAPNAIVIRAPEQAGLFYGVQSLLQLLPTEVFASNAVANASWQVPCVRIEDQPRFKWRGLMLDVSRHFFTKDEVKRFIDEMALHKFNVFHWHLVDDNGWRIEIKKYPRLTQVGAWRKDIEFDSITKSSTAYGPDGRYGGFYTQDDIREIVAYAQKR